MNPRTTKLRPGDLVEVRSPQEIFQTLDADGTLDRLPFMPEMIQFCGRKFQVSKRVLKTCYYTKLGTSGFRKFRADDVVLLDGLRCSGSAHDGCQKACVIFWREAWLRKAKDSCSQETTDLAEVEQLRARLKTLAASKVYFCQSTELLNASEPLTRSERAAQCFREVRVGNCSALWMTRRILSWVFWKTRWKLLGEYARGSNKPVPVGSLQLHPGEWIEVNSMKSIKTTLNEAGCNRGLFFMPDMRKACGNQLRVERRVEKIIVDGTGEMRQLRDTVFLEGSHCGCAYSLGGCPRNEFSYWREGWLHRLSCAEKTNPTKEHEAIEVQS